MKKQIAIVSADSEIVELARDAGFEVLGFFDPKELHDCLKAKRLGDDSDWPKIFGQNQNLRVALAVDIPETRRKLWNHYGAQNIETLISKHAIVSSSSTVGVGVLVQHGCKLMATASVGNGCKINVNATVHHGCSVGHFCTIAPGAQLLGNVTVEDDVYIGAGAIVLPRRKIGRGAVVGAGAVVSHDVRPGVTVVGIPAKERR